MPPDCGICLFEDGMNVRPVPRSAGVGFRSMAAAADKRQLILAAAVRVFAAQGYEASRVGDVAKEAGVAYGLVYHYFGSKEAVLEAVFREQWGRLLAAVALAEETGDSAPEQLALVVKIVLRAWGDDP